MSDLLRFRLNHFFLLDLSLLSMLPFSELSVLFCSTGYLLLLLPAPRELVIVRSVVNEEWMSSLSLNISSTCRDHRSLATCISNFRTECHNKLFAVFKINSSNYNNTYVTICFDSNRMPPMSLSDNTRGEILGQQNLISVVPSPSTKPPASQWWRWVSPALLPNSHPSLLARPCRLLHAP